jgi:hypothetical protein
MSTGSRNTCAMYIRDSKWVVPGYGPSQRSSARLAPTKGIDKATA